MSDDKKDQNDVPAPTGIIQFEKRTLTKKQLDSLLNIMPVKIIFIDENDTVRYFNKPERIIFIRTKANQNSD